MHALSHAQVIVSHSLRHTLSSLFIQFTRMKNPIPKLLPHHGSLNNKTNISVFVLFNSEKLFLKDWIELKFGIFWPCVRLPFKFFFRQISSEAFCCGAKTKCQFPYSQFPGIGNLQNLEDPVMVAVHLAAAAQSFSLQGFLLLRRRSRWWVRPRRRRRRQRQRRWGRRRRRRRRWYSWCRCCCAGPITGAKKRKKQPFCCNFTEFKLLEKQRRSFKEAQNWF